MDRRATREDGRAVALGILRSRHVGVPPMEYLLAWRMALAKDPLRHDVQIADVAGRTGYGSASAVSTAFSRHTGQSPGRYARAAVAAD